MKNPLQTLFFFLFILASPGAGAVDSKAVKAQQEMCAKTSPAEAAVTTEAQGACLECLAAGAADPGLLKIQVQAQTIDLQARKRRDLQLFREFKSSLSLPVVPTLENLKKSLEESEFSLKLYKIIRFAGSDAEFVTQFINKSFEYHQNNNYLGGWTSEEKAAYLQSLKTLKKLVDDKIQACLKASDEVPEGKGGWKFQLDAQRSQFKVWQTNLDNLEKSIQEVDAGNFKSLLAQIINALNYSKASEAELKQSESLIDANRKKIQDMEKEAAEVQAEDAEALELKTYENAVRASLSSDEIEEGLCGMTPAEIWTLRYYTGPGYRDVNASLRQDPALPKYQNYRDVLNSALAKIKKYKGDVERGTTLPLEVFAQHQIGAVVTYPAFTSTSTTKGWSGAQRYVIKSKTGHFVDPISTHQGENEVIFPAGTKFKILNMELRVPVEPGDPPGVIEDKKRTVNILMEEVDGESP